MGATDGKREYKSTPHELEYGKETYRWYKAHGVCVKCHHRDAMQDSTMCPECAEKNRQTCKEYYNNPAVKERRKEYMREYMRRYRREEMEWVK